MTLEAFSEARKHIFFLHSDGDLDMSSLKNVLESRDLSVFDFLDSLCMDKEMYIPMAIEIIDTILSSAGDFKLLYHGDVYCSVEDLEIVRGDLARKIN